MCGSATTVAVETLWNSNSYDKGNKKDGTFFRDGPNLPHGGLKNADDYKTTGYAVYSSKTGIDRIEAIPDRKEGILHVKDLWWEAGIRQTKALHSTLERTLKKFAQFNDCRTVNLDELQI